MNNDLHLQRRMCFLFATSMYDRDFSVKFTQKYFVNLMFPFKPYNEKENNGSLRVSFLSVLHPLLQKANERFYDIKAGGRHVIIKIINADLKKKHIHGDL